MPEPARAGVPEQLAHRLRVDPHGAGVHGPRPERRDRRRARHRRQDRRAGGRVREAARSGCWPTSRCWSTPRRRAPGAIDPKKLPGVVVDDDAAERKGFEAVEQRASAPFVGAATGTTAARSDGKQSATLRRPTCRRPGKYEVRLAYTAEPEPGDERAGDGRPRRRQDGGEGRTSGRRRRSTGVGVARARSGSRRARPAPSTIGNAGADGHVIIDAVQWLPVKE